MKQLSKQEAIKFENSQVWEDWPDDQLAGFQLFQKRLCIDFSRFHKAMETVLDRPIFTHEFADRDKLIAEYLGKKEPPTMEEILNLIPKEKRLILFKTN